MSKYAIDSQNDFVMQLFNGEYKLEYDLYSMSMTLQVFYPMED
jgi:hypothetical protein